MQEWVGAAVARVCCGVWCRFQKASLYGWAGGSLCTVIAEAWELTELNQTVRRKDESEEAWQARQLRAISDINSHSLVLFHALVQVLILPTMHQGGSRPFQPSGPYSIVCNTAVPDQMLFGYARAGTVDLCGTIKCAPVSLQLPIKHALARSGRPLQGALATGLLGLTSWKPRFVGFLGVVASAINCYMLFPALPKPAAKPARKEVQLESLKPATLKLA